MILTGVVYISFYAHAFLRLSILLLLLYFISLLVWKLETAGSGGKVKQCGVPLDTTLESIGELSSGIISQGAKQCSPCVNHRSGLHKLFTEMSL
jgi:hypothetical protein